MQHGSADVCYLVLIGKESPQRKRKKQMFTLEVTNLDSTKSVTVYTSDIKHGILKLHAELVKFGRIAAYKEI